MNKDDLKQLGLTDDELIQKIIVLHGKGIESHKATNATLTAQVTTMTGQLDEANKKIESFKQLDPDKIRREADEWKTKAEKAAEEGLRAVQAIRLDHAVETALVAAKARNPKAVRALIEGELKLAEDGSVAGLEGQLAKIKEGNAFLFEGEETARQNLRIVTGGAGKGEATTTDSVILAARRAAGLETK